MKYISYGLIVLGFLASSSSFAEETYLCSFAVTGPAGKAGGDLSKNMIVTPTKESQRVSLKKVHKEVFLSLTGPHDSERDPRIKNIFILSAFVSEPTAELWHTQLSTYIVPGQKVIELQFVDINRYGYFLSCYRR